MIRQSSAARRSNRLANRKASPFSKQSIAHAARVMAPTFFALAISGVAHAQGTMDFSGAQTLMGTFKTILSILKKAGGWHHGLYLKIENPPYMALVIEATDESGPCGLPAISVAHYGEQNGDLMRDPEMCFELGFADGPHLNPFYYRNDYVGVEQWSRAIVRDNYVYLVSLHQQHERFAKVWDNNLRLQGFAEAFERQQQTPRA
jgi:hypothetical protein